MNDRSILRQLKKYQPPKQEADKVEVVVPDKTDSGLDLKALASKIVPAMKVPEVTKLLGSMQLTRWVDILYPMTTLARYHLFYNHHYQTSEQGADAEITAFMRNVDLQEYSQKFIVACDEETRRVVLIRCLLATFADFKNPRDRIPSEYRSRICNRLGIQITSLKSAVAYQERMKSELTMEQQILGRLGYVMIWNMIHTPAGPSTEIPLLEDGR